MADAHHRVDEDTLEQYRTIARARAARLDKNVTLKSVTDEALRDALPALKKAEGIE